MAYMSQERKKKLAPRIKAVLKAYGLKGTIGVENHSSLYVKIKSGKIDFIKNYNEWTCPHGSARTREHKADGYIQVNEYWLEDGYTGTALKCLKELSAAMNVGNHDNSDPMTDYFDVGWYTHIYIGNWNKPYEVT